MERIKKSFYNEIKFFVLLPALLWQILFLIMPFLFILYLSFFDKSGAFTLNNFISVLDYTHFKIIFRTILIALFNAILCATIGYPVAYFLALKANKWKVTLIFFLTLPLWVNFLVQVYSWFFVLQEHGVVNNILMSMGLIKEPFHAINNIFAVIIVMLHVYLPFMIMPLYNALEKFDTGLVEASLDLGASSWQTFWKVTFPLTLSGLRLGFFLVLVMSFGEVAIPLLLGGSKSFFVGTLIYEYFLGAKNANQGAAFTLVSAIALLIILITSYLIFKKKNKGQTSESEI